MVASACTVCLRIRRPTCGTLPCRTNAVAVGPATMMCKQTPTLILTYADFSNSPTRSHSERAARRNCIPQLRASSFRARHKTQLNVTTAARCKPHLQPAMHMTTWWLLVMAHPYAWNYYSVRGIAARAGAWSDQAATAGHVVHVSNYHHMRGIAEHAWGGGRVGGSQ